MLGSIGVTDIASGSCLHLTLPQCERYYWARWPTGGTQKGILCILLFEGYSSSCNVVNCSGLSPVYRNILNYHYLRGWRCLDAVSLLCLQWKKRKQADGNLLTPKDGLPKAVPWILFFHKRWNAHKMQKLFPPLWCIVLCLALTIPIPLFNWIRSWNNWVSVKISSVPVVISFLAFYSTFASYLIICFQHSLLRNIICISFNGKSGMAFHGGLLSCTSTPYQRYSSASCAKHFEISMEFINC